MNDRLRQYRRGLQLQPLEDRRMLADFNGDGFVNGIDVDLLQENIINGPQDPGLFDITGDGFVTVADREQWLDDAGEANLFSGNAYAKGDANLDGIVDGLDFIVWNENKFTNSTAWTNGDFTADGIVDGVDFISWNDNKFTSVQNVVAIEMHFIDDLGNRVQSVRPGESFQLVVTVEDIRDTPEGVFSAYVDVLYDSGLVTVGDDVYHSTTYDSGTSGDFPSPGSINEAGGVDGTSPLGAGEFELFRVPMVAGPSEGVVEFSTDPADLPINETTVFGLDVAVDPSFVSYGQTSLTIQSVALQLELFDLAGNPIDTVSVGEAFELRVFTQDLRLAPQGVFAAFLDVIYTADLVFVDGPIVHSATYDAATFGDTSVPGLIDEVGGVDGLTPLGGDPFEVFRIQMRAGNTPGTAVFEGDMADDLVQHPVLLFNATTESPEDQIDFGQATLNISPSVDMVLETTNINGVPIDSVTVGQSFLLRGFTQDLRNIPEGVFAAFMDVYFSSGLVSVNGSIQHSVTYDSATSGSTELPGLIDEVGGVDGFSPLGGGLFEVFSIPMIAGATPGIAHFQADPVEDLAQHAVLLFGVGEEIDTDLVRYGKTSIQITPQSAVYNGADVSIPELSETSHERLNEAVFDESHAARIEISKARSGQPLQSTAGPADYVNVTERRSLYHHNANDAAMAELTDSLPGDVDDWESPGF